MSGRLYSDLIAQYIKINYSSRGLEVYQEVHLGKTIIGKNRSIDIFLLNKKTNSAFAIECKYQDVRGTTDEKIPYTLNDMAIMPIKRCVTYAGKGFSEGVLHMLEAHPYAVYCLPDETHIPSKNTHELDEILAAYFSWWDVILLKKASL